MIRKIFWEDAYIREFETTVLESSEGRVILDATAFNPRGGGLPGDTGTIAGIQVVDTVKEDDSVTHILGAQVQLAAGMKVNGALDWERRYRIMRM